MKSFTWFTTLLLLCLELAHAAHVSRSGGGFPSLGFKMPSKVPSSLDGWWSDYKSDLGFLGFSYWVTQCQSPATLQSEFKDMRTRFNARYVRIEGGCDKDGFYDTIVDAAWDAGLGVQAMIWFDDYSDNNWMGRRDKLLGTLHTNPKAKFVTRAVQFGSGTVFVLDFATPDLLADQINAAKKNLTSLGIPVTVSDQVSHYQSNGGAQSVLDAIDFVDLIMLPYYSYTASIAFKSGPDIFSDLQWMTSKVNGKKILLSMNGWPQVTPGPNTPSPNAVASLDQMVDYFVLLELYCSVFKRNAGGGVAWFAHAYSVEQDPVYGFLKNGEPQFKFAPLTSC